MGPLQGIRVVEFAGLGPAPMAAMILADLGAEVLCIERKRGGTARPGEALFDPAIDILRRGRRLLRLDLKHPDALATALRLIGTADAVIEGFRPGVMERLGLGPEVCLGANPKLVYGRMTGWGQTGPLAQTAGHDINYVALSGALHAIGVGGGKPVVPLNLVADGGGAMLLAVGMLAALLHARDSGQGQVVDAAMTDGSALMMSMIYTLKAMGQWTQRRGSNLLDGGAPFYDTYRCLDGKWLAVGAIEPQFYAALLDKAGLSDPDFAAQWERQAWPELKQKLAAALLRRTRDAWCEIFAGSDACVAPVLDMDEAPHHPHNAARGTFVDVDGVMQPAPAPRFSQTRTAAPAPPPTRDEGGDLLADWGFEPAAIAALETGGVVSPRRASPAHRPGRAASPAVDSGSDRPADA